MMDQIAQAIAKADRCGLRADSNRYRRLALAALKALVRPTEAMIDAAPVRSVFRRFVGDHQPPGVQEKSGR